MSRAHHRRALSVRGIGWIALAAGLAVSPWIHSISPAFLAIPLLASILVLGLPHGALDHRTAALLWPLSATANQILFYAVYLALAGCYLWLWFIDPLAAFVFFLILTVFHWGQGDVDFENRRDPGEGGLRKHPILMTFVRGGAPVFLPVLFWPGVVETVAGWVFALFPSSFLTADQAPPAIPLALRIPLGAVYFSAVAWALVVEIRSKTFHSKTRTGGSGITDSLGETVGLVLFFSFVHPLLAISLYFPFWHGLRHLDGLRVDLSAGRGPLGWRDILLASVPLTLVSIVMMAALGILAAGEWTPPSIAGLYLVLLAILTLPHAVVVGARDHFGPGARRVPGPFSPETKTRNQTRHA
ncbi:MAG: Brp/Blh family beta-carotene 15,15'-dioxygenase [Puniceicoccaceae bacterium]